MILGSGEIRGNAEMFRAPGAEIGQRLHEFFARYGKRVGNLGRGRVRGFSVDDAIRLELTKLGCEDFLADAR